MITVLGKSKEGSPMPVHLTSDNNNNDDDEQCTR